MSYLTTCNFDYEIFVQDFGLYPKKMENRKKKLDFILVYRLKAFIVCFLNFEIIVNKIVVGVHRITSTIALFGKVLQFIE